MPQAQEILLRFRQLLTIAVSPWLTLLSCSDGDTPFKPIQINGADTVQLAWHRSAVIAGTSIALQFDSLLFDWRVPIKDQVYGVVYIDNGLAEIELSLSNPAGRMRLPIDAVPPDSIGESRPGLPVHRAGYQFSLLELSPMREEAGQVFPDSEYVATILVEPDTLPPAVPGDFFPLEAGNSWTYADTVWVNGSISSETYDVVVLHQFEDVLGPWWQLSRATDFLYSMDASIMLRRDSVYFRQAGEFIRPYGSCWSYPMLFYIEPENTVDTFYSLVEGDIANTRYVRLLTDTSIVVPAGEFTTVYEFSGNFWIYSDCRIYFAPGVGVVLFEASGYYQNRRAVLISYSLQNR